MVTDSMVFFLRLPLQSDKAVYKTAPATPGLLNRYFD